MHAIVQLLTKHSYSVLFGGLLAQHLGLPIPAALLLLAAAALAAAGKMGIVTALAVAIAACVLGDWAWYEAGRQKGDKVLHFIHRLTQDPDTHDQQAKSKFARHGLALLLIAEFVPALNVVVAPLAGISRITRLRFLALDGTGAALYSSTYFALGYVFSNDLARIAAYVSRVGTFLGALMVMAILILAGRHLLRPYRLTYQLGSRGRTI